MRLPASFLLLLLSATTGLCQTDLVEVDLVSFHSPDEKEIFHNHVRKAESDKFMVFIASGTLLTEAKISEAKSRFYNFLSQYKDAKFQGKKSEKKVKQIYDDLHKNFLKKYQEDASFEEIFYNGNYNSISAAGLFALAFDELAIPYKINEQQQGVYFIAYPDSESIKVETSSAQGLTTLDEAYKQNYVDVLKNIKAISAQEASSQTTSRLFEKYYYGNQNYITALNLAGLQYLHDAQKKLEARNFEAAFAQAEKAYLLYPSQKTSYSLLVAGTNAFQSRKQQDSLKAMQLSKLTRYSELGITSEMIQAEFNLVIQNLLFEKGKKTDILHFYNVLSNHVENVQMKLDLEYLFHFEFGRYLNSMAKFNEALKYFEKALKAQPEKAEAVNGFVTNLVGIISESSDNLNSLRLIEKYSGLYPSLHENNVFNTMLFATYLVQIAIEFDNQTPVQGEKYKSTFEELLKKYPDVQPNAELVGQAYSRAAIYYYRKGQTPKAKNLIQSGLKISPNNYELLSRQRMIN
jgi:tetratricopeptide (TPR) repeat protein